MTGNTTNAHWLALMNRPKTTMEATSDDDRSTLGVFVAVKSHTYLNGKPVALHDIATHQKYQQSMPLF